jgi:hypothetical protein
MTTEQKIIRAKVGLLELAKQHSLEVEHSCQRSAERLLKSLDNLPPDAALMLTARSLARPASTGARGS